MEVDICSFVLIGLAAPFNWTAGTGASPCQNVCSVHVLLLMHAINYHDMSLHEL